MITAHTLMRTGLGLIALSLAGLGVDLGMDGRIRTSAILLSLALLVAIVWIRVAEGRR